MVSVKAVTCMADLLLRKKVNTHHVTNFLHYLFMASRFRSSITHVVDFGYHFAITMWYTRLFYQHVIHAVVDAVGSLKLTNPMLATKDIHYLSA
jgi:hypothetical protein